MFIQELIPNINVEDYTNEFLQCLLTGLDSAKKDNELKWLREIVAFSNTLGGCIYVGVNDKTHELMPLSHQELDKTVQMVHEKMEERVEPNVALTMDALAVDETTPTRYILKITVPKSKFTPVYVHVNGVPACFIRQFGRAKIATPEQIAQLVIMSSRASYDNLQTEQIFNKNDYLKLYEEYQKANEGKELNERILRSIGFMDENNHLAQGALLFKDEVVDPITLMKATVFPTFDKGGNTIVAREEFRGCLLDLVKQSVDYILDHSTSGYRKTATSRVNWFSYPKRAVFEGVVNALAHRNYFVGGTEIQLDIFPDRLEITSPGSLLNGNNIEREKNIGKIQPQRRNELICSVFELVHMMEAKGTGFDKIMEDYRGVDEAHKPFISSDDATFTLTLPDLTFDGGVVGVDNPYPDVHLLKQIVSPCDEKILSCCYTKERSLTDISSYLGVSSSTHLRNDILGKLVTEGYLIRRRIGKAFYYVTNREKIETN